MGNLTGSQNASHMGDLAGSRSDPGNNGGSGGASSNNRDSVSGKGGKGNKSESESGTRQSEPSRHTVSIPINSAAAALSGLPIKLVDGGINMLEGLGERSGAGENRKGESER